MTKPISRLICSIAGGLLVCLAATSSSLAQQSSFDVPQLTPEQRQKALAILGQQPGSDTQLGQSRLPPSSHTGQSTGYGMPRDGASAIPSPASSVAQAPSARLSQPPQPANGNDVTANLKPFGYDLFASAPASTFAPDNNVPIPANYVLGPGDNIDVLLYGSTDASFALTVDRDGYVSFPKLGPINVAGQKFDDVRSMLQERLAKQTIGVKASITLGELRSLQVFLLGDVKQPGAYTVSSLSTITNALLVGGGVSLIGSLRNIQLKRQGKVVRILDLYDLLLRGDSSKDERLQPGDVIFVPPVGPRVSVGGEVRRPAIYELKSERKLSEVLSMAGGTMASTSTDAIAVTRYDQNRRSILLQIDASKPAGLNTALQDGDIVDVRKLSGPVANSVNAMGYLRYPGNYAWAPDLDLKKLLQMAQVLPSETGKEAYLPLGLIQRTDPSSGIRSWQSFNVTNALSDASSPFKLHRDDLVVVLSHDEISYLDSKAVRDVAAGDFTNVDKCPGLKELSSDIGNDRSLRYIKILNAQTSLFATQKDSLRDSTGSAAADDTTSAAGGDGTSPDITVMDAKAATANTRAAACPQTFIDAPSALPYLLDQSVDISGEVLRPGLYPVVQGTPLDEIVEAAGGRSQESDPTKIEYVAFENALKTGRPEYQDLDVDQAHHVRLGPGDSVDFRPLYTGQEIGTVKVAGEFRFPGTYDILRDEHLSELMHRAGGLTESAYPDGAIFTRESAAREERQSYVRAAKELQSAVITAISSGLLGGKESSVPAEFIGATIQRLESAPVIGRVVISADPAVLAAKPALDPILEPGDKIFMPKRPINVTVAGQVLNPGSLQYLPGTSVRQYIRKAGGYGQAADTDRTFVVLPNGTAQKVSVSFWHPSDQSVPPGSLIIVPRDPAPFNLIGWSDRIFGVISQMAITAASLKVVTQ